MDFSQRAAGAATLEINVLLCPLLDEAITAKKKADYASTRGSGVGTMAAKRIGAAYIGTPCLRELGFRFHRYEVEERDSAVSPGELTRHGEAGHWTEEKTAEWMALAGITICTVLQDEHGRAVKNEWGEPKQIGWVDGKDPVTGQFRMAGEVDGVITACKDVQLAALLAPPCVWESKKATDKKWKKFSKEKVKGADPKYYGQLQTNMGYLGIRQTLFSMLNLDTMKYYFELVAFDQFHAQGLVDRATGVFNSDHPFQLPRLGRAEDDFVCRFCDYKNQCWHGGVAAVRPAPKSGFNPNEMDEVLF